MKQFGKLGAGVSILLLLGTAACSNGAHPHLPRMHSIPAAAAVVANADDVGFHPAMELRTRDIKRGTRAVPVVATVQAPVISGVDPAYARKFTAEFESMLAADMMYVARKSAEYLPDLANYCGSEGDELCAVNVRFKATKAQIHKDHATISYELGMSIVGGMPSTRSKSLTMNLRTGRIEPAGVIL